MLFLSKHEHYDYNIHSLKKTLIYECKVYSESRRSEAQ